MYIYDFEWSINHYENSENVLIEISYDDLNLFLDQIYFLDSE